MTMYHREDAQEDFLVPLAFRRTGYGEGWLPD